MKLGREAVVFTRTAFEARGLSLFLRRDRCLNASRCHGDAAAPLPAFDRLVRSGPPRPRALVFGPLSPVFRPRSRRALAFSDRRVVVFWFGVLIGPKF